MKKNRMFTLPAVHCQCHFHLTHHRQIHPFNLKGGGGAMGIFSESRYCLQNHKMLSEYFFLANIKRQKKYPLKNVEWMQIYRLFVQLHQCSPSVLRQLIFMCYEPNKKQHLSILFGKKIVIYGFKSKMQHYVSIPLVQLQVMSNDS